MRDSEKVRNSFTRLYRRHPSSPDEFEAYVRALELKIKFNRGSMTVGEIRAQLEASPELEGHFLEITKAETEKQQREQNT